MPLKKKSILLIKIVLVFSTYSYIFFKIYTSKEISEFNFSKFDLNQFKIVIFTCVVFFMVLNWLLESLKWKMLVSSIKDINILQSLSSILAGLSVGIFTPNRLGEFAGRPYFLDKDKIVSGVAAAVTGSFSQSFVTVFMGVPAINFYAFSTENKFIISEFHLIAVLIFSIILLILISLFFFNPAIIIKFKNKLNFIKKHEEDLYFLKNYKFTKLIHILFISFSRYAVFSIQFYLLLLFFDVEISAFNAFVSIALIYLFLFAIPGFVLSEIGVRASLAIFFLGMYSVNYIAILSATILLWIINLAFPAILGTFIVLAKNSERNVRK